CAAASKRNRRGEMLGGALFSVNSHGFAAFVSTGVANSKVYSTGTVTSFSGSGHITVTGSGANWTGLDDGAHCFWMTHGADLYGSSLHHVFQIDSGSGGGGRTTLTISYFVEDVGHRWSDDDPGTGSGGTGLYAIAPS